MTNAVQLLFPVRCKQCGAGLQASRGVLCADCLADGDYFLRERFSVAGADGADAPLVYRDLVRRAMHAYKFQHRRAYADWFAQQAGGCLLGWLDDWRPDLITFVPLSFGRWTRRGYNQSALVARLIAAEVGLACEGCLTKRPFVRAQSSVAHAARSEHIKDAFAARKSVSLRGRRVVLVDDVVTTGATAAVCARVLRDMGAEAVFVLGMTKTAPGNQK